MKNAIFAQTPCMTEFSGGVTYNCLYDGILDSVNFLNINQTTFLNVDFVLFGQDKIITVILSKPSRCTTARIGEENWIATKIKDFLAMTEKAVWCCL